MGSWSTAKVIMPNLIESASNCRTPGTLSMLLSMLWFSDIKREKHTYIFNIKVMVRVAASSS